jgi:hypothetical protein
VDADLERREVVAGALRLVELQHAHEHGGHDLGVGDPVLLDEPEEVDGSKRSMAITVPPRRSTAIENRSGAAWYIGAATGRCCRR